MVAQKAAVLHINQPQYSWN